MSAVSVPINAAPEAHPDRPYLPLLAGLRFRPTFIMGDHRSGTTILYKLLGLSGHFNIVTAYHIINYGELLYNHIHGRSGESRAALAARFAELGLSDRGFDALLAGPDTPEEYGFILRGEGQRPRLRPANRASLVELAQKVQFTGDPRRGLLLKNPWDYFLNFRYVKRAFPDSRFIFIQRHPLDTINSQLRATRELFAAQNPYVALVAGWYRRLWAQPARLRAMRLLFSPQLGLGRRLVLRHVARAGAYFLANVGHLPSTDYICIRYEDLCRDPAATIGRLLAALGLEGGGSIDYRGLLAPRDGRLLPEIEALRATAHRRMRPFYERFGYSA